MRATKHSRASPPASSPTPRTSTASGTSTRSAPSSHAATSSRTSASRSSSPTAAVSCSPSPIAAQSKRSVEFLIRYETQHRRLYPEKIRFWVLGWVLYPNPKPKTQKYLYPNPKHKIFLGTNVWPKHKCYKQIIIIIAQDYIIIIDIVHNAPY